MAHHMPGSNHQSSLGLPVRIVSTLVLVLGLVVVGCGDGEAPSGATAGKRERTDGAAFERTANAQAEKPAANQTAKNAGDDPAGSQADWFVLKPTDMRAVKGHAYRITLPAEYQATSDGNGATNRSRLQLQEDGAALSPAHTVHRKIESDGGGRYSHWGSGLRFSASDNSDPRTNGKVYRVRL